MQFSITDRVPENKVPIKINDEQNSDVDGHNIENSNSIVTQAMPEEAPIEDVNGDINSRDEENEKDENCTGTQPSTSKFRPTSTFIAKTTKVSSSKSQCLVKA